MTTNSKTAPASMSWWRMFWMILTQNTALGPYLKIWQGADPYRCIQWIKLTAIGAVLATLLVKYSVGRPWGESIAVFSFYLGVTGLLASVAITIMNGMSLIGATSSFRVIWNSQKLNLLERNEFDRGMIKAIMTPTATYWAEKVIRLETSGLDRLPKGCREKSSHKRKIDTYVSACLGMGLGCGTLTHKELVKVVFSIAQGSF